MSDDVIPRYSLVMNTNYWPLKRGPFSSKPWWPQSFAQMFSSRSQGREGDPWSPAGNGGGGAGPPGRTPARPARGQAGRARERPSCTCSSPHPPPEGGYPLPRPRPASGPPGRLPAPDLVPIPGGKDNTF